MNSTRSLGLPASSASRDDRIRYLNRWRNGSGLGVGVNWFGSNGPSTAVSQPSSPLLGPSSIVGCPVVDRASSEPRTATAP